MIDFAYLALRPALRLISPETAHSLAVRALASGWVRPRAKPDEGILACRVWGRDLPNPIGLAAGFDKGAEAPDALLGLGFGHVEVGGVTPEPQPGNPRPRVFRLEADRAIINRYGLNSEGLGIVASRLRARAGRPGFVLANLGRNKETRDEIADYALGAATLAGSVDALVINVSSPNTPGLRDLQARAAMSRLVEAVRASRDRAGSRVPVLVKLAPDLDEAGLSDAAAVALETGLDGLIMGNTTVGRPAELRDRHRAETGGLSGRPLMAVSTGKLALLYRLTEGRIPLVGCGGVSSGADAYAKIKAGASLVQLYSALVFEGPGVVGRIKRDLARLMRRDGVGSVAEAVGLAHR